jgi:2-polyprenyl-3-methyl-5-hydroxy-6-metoxy-1,4-benzoquinol methylase
VKHDLTKIKNCPICKKEEMKYFLSATDHNVSGDKFNLSSCCSCGFVFTNPIPTLETIGRYYKSENYISHSRTKKGLINTMYHIVRKHQINKKEGLIGALTKDKNLLDIGCGTGEFISHCKNMGWNVSGTEPEEKARKLNTEVDAVHENIYSKKIKNNSFSVVTMWHVLEHVYNLEQDLLKIKNLIKNKGFLIVAVPNHESYDGKHYKENWAAYDVPIHLYHFRQGDIENLFSKMGFTLKKVKPLIFDSYYISLLSEQKKGGNPINAIINGFLSNLKAKRQNNYSSLIYILQKND